MDEADEDVAPDERSSGKAAASRSWSAHLRKLRDRQSAAAAADVNDDREDGPVSSSSWQFKRTLKKGKTPELFCRQCGSLLPRECSFVTVRS